MEVKGKLVIVRTFEGDTRRYENASSQMLQTGELLIRAGGGTAPLAIFAKGAWQFTETREMVEQWNSLT